MALFQFAISQNFVQETCCNCGCAFALSLDMYNKLRLDNSKWFYCPNGHQQHYTKSEIADLKEKLEVSKKDVEWQRAQRLREERRAAAARGQVTKLKNRISAGLCPCCRRTFSNLSRHMSHMHPSFKNQDGAQ